MKSKIEKNFPYTPNNFTICYHQKIKGTAFKELQRDSETGTFCECYDIVKKNFFIEHIWWLLLLNL